MWNVKHNNSRKNNLSNVIILFEILNQILLFENYKNFGCCCCCVCVCVDVFIFYFETWTTICPKEESTTTNTNTNSIDIQYTICRFHNCCRMHHMAHHEHFMTIVNKTLIGIRQMYEFFNCWSGLSYIHILCMFVYVYVYVWILYRKKNNHWHCMIV